MKWSDVPEMLRRRRKEAGIRQQDVANMLGCSKQSISQWELGSRQVDPDLVGPWAGLLGLQVVLEVVPADWEVSIRPPAFSGERRAALDAVRELLTRIEDEDVETVINLGRLLDRMPRAARAALKGELQEWARDLPDVGGTTPTRAS